MKVSMYRFHLFEIEDQPWCPRWIRQAITDMLMAIHRWFGTAELLADQLDAMIEAHGQAGPVTIIDGCSGSGGPLPETLRLLQQRHTREIRLWMTDIYPNPEAVARFGNGADSAIRYLPQSVDATEPLAQRPEGLVIRTMVCSFHHLRPEQARSVLTAAQAAGDPLLIFEISDNRTPPRWLWWVALGPNFLFGLWVALFLKPRTPGRLLFSFLLPVIPACFAWDGAVSNVRTYGAADINRLVSEAGTQEFTWTCETVAGRWLPHWVVVGQPRRQSLVDPVAAVD